MKRVLVFGTFDGIHDGHREFLKQAKSLGDVLIVAIAPDMVVEHLKNKMPQYTESERQEMIFKDPSVDEVVIGDYSLSTYDVIATVDPDIIALGYDQDALEADLEKWLRHHPESHISLVKLQPHRGDELHSSLLQK